MTSGEMEIQHKLAQLAALSTHCGLLCIRQQGYMKEAKEQKEWLMAAKAELRLELYEWFEQELSRILNG